MRDLEKYDVSISIKQGTENKISIQGLKNDVLKVTNKIQEMFRHLDKQDRHVEEVRLLTKQVLSVCLSVCLSVHERGIQCYFSLEFLSHSP